MADLYDVLADDLHLTDGDRGEILSSGLQPVYKNRISWARTFLKKAGLIDQPSRGVVRISVRGRDALASGKAIDNAYLMQFPEFAAFFRRPRENGKTTVAIEGLKTSRQMTHWNASIANYETISHRNCSNASRSHRLRSSKNSWSI